MAWTWPKLLGVYVAGTALAIWFLFFVIPHLGMWRDPALELVGIVTTLGSLALRDICRDERQT